MTREEYLFVENLKGFRSYREIKRGCLKMKTAFFVFAKKSGST